MESCCIAQKAQLSARDDLEEEEGAREAQEGGDICIHIADSHCCTAGTNTTL